MIKKLATATGDLDKLIAEHRADIDEELVSMLEGRAKAAELWVPDLFALHSSATIVHATFESSTLHFGCLWVQRLLFLRLTA